MNPVVSVIMGSDSDLPVMKAALAVLQEFTVPYECQIVSAHRTPLFMVNFAQLAHGRGIRVIIAGAGGAAHLPGMVASLSPLPVIGVPVPTAHLGGLDSLYSIVQMPGGIPVATVAIGQAKNAGLLAVRILATHDPELQAKMLSYQARLAAEVEAKQERLQRLGAEQYLQEML
ncbi:5-(carboxyamino)imidazole ribonucleotide mutase [Candidatus Cyanaurora vandensis]|uniref:5-(carboxyamino)imidazole ribonucleotide mutase n=1 Tax=Candidatus Cyanaurora vandensis TaxID=2714958 RepID=UPI002580CC36|nr:5-(carboxyamino)imidazole ribonucleotide mutase [Candidatus Cyanaurora vandensis]